MKAVKIIIRILFCIAMLFEAAYLFINLSPFLLPIRIWQPVFYMVNPRYHYLVYIKPTYGIMVFLIIIFMTKFINRKTLYISEGLCFLNLILWFILGMSV